MKLHIQTDDDIRARAKAYVHDNERRGRKTSLSGLFKELRRNTRNSFFGDFPLIEIALRFVKDTSRKSIQHAFSTSREMMELRKGERMRLADYLSTVAGSI